MKKLICLILCLTFALGMLVSCGNDEIGADLDKLKDKVQSEVVNELELDLYVIVGEGTTQNAINTVELMINQHLEKFKTSLDIHYLTADEYVETVYGDLSLEGDDKADIVLITSEDQFTTLREERLIANITSYFDPVKSPYRSLNTQICSALLSAAAVPEEMKNSAGTTYISNNHYCVPNNRVVGEYQIVIINRDISEYYGIGELTAKEMITAELCQPLYDKIDNDPAQKYSRDEAVIITTGSYADVLAYQADGRYIVNIQAPYVTSADAYTSAFAIARHPADKRHEIAWDDVESSADVKQYSNYYNRCMQVIYELNTNADMRNLLLYGKLNTNYRIDEETGYVVHDEIGEDDIYVMDILYTGDVFKAYYCDCELHSWTKEDAEYGEIQNKDAVVFIEPTEDDNRSEN